MISEVTLTFILLNLVKGEVIVNNTSYNGTREPDCVPTNGQLCVPKCCDLDSLWYVHINKPNEYYCTKDTARESRYVYEVYESNATHINTESDRRNISVYPQSLQCNKSRLLRYEDVEFPLGLIYNSSVILVDIRAKKVSLIPPSNYCVEYTNITKEVKIRICGEGTPPVPSIEYPFYFVFLILSTVCYFVSAAFYIWVLKITDIHRKCFVAFAISMGFAFLFLIFLHKTDSSKCDILGFFFYLFAVSGFLWLMFLCLDLVVEVRFFNQEAKVERWWWYMAVSIIYPAVTLFISIIPDGKIDVPNSFIKELYYEQVRCRFNNPRLEPFFFSIGLLMLASLIFLITTIYFIRVNNRDYRNQFNWIDKRSSYKYMCSRVAKCSVIYFLMLMFFCMELLMSLLEVEGNFINALLICTSSVGCLILLVVLSHYYHQKTIEKNSTQNESEMEPL